MSEAIHPTTTATETERAAASARQAARSLSRSPRRLAALKRNQFQRFSGNLDGEGAEADRPSERGDGCRLLRAHSLRRREGGPGQTVRKWRLSERASADGQFEFHLGRTSRPNRGPPERGGGVYACLGRSRDPFGSVIRLPLCSRNMCDEGRLMSSVSTRWASVLKADPARSRVGEPPIHSV